MNEVLAGMAVQAMITAALMRLGYKVDPTHQVIAGMLLLVASAAWHAIFGAPSP